MDARLENDLDSQNCTERKGLDRRKTHHTVDGRKPPNQWICSFFHYLQDFIDLRWCRISSINSREGEKQWENLNGKDRK